MRKHRLIACLVCVALGSISAFAAPVAYFVEVKDSWTKTIGLEAQLRKAGFEPKPLNLKTPPSLSEMRIADLVIFGAFAIQHPDYGAFMKNRKSLLLDYVEAGGVVATMTQSDQDEAIPPFLPKGVHAKRKDPDYANIHVLAPEHPLFANIELLKSNPPQWSVPGKLGGWEVVWEAFQEQNGCRVLLAADPRGAIPGALEIQHGKGRILLFAFAFDKIGPTADKPTMPSGWIRAGEELFPNLKTYTRMAREGKLPTVTPTPAPERPKPLNFVEGSETLVVLPDTQMYSERYPQHFYNQTAWIAKNHDARDIRYVLHLGDITNRNNDSQWGVAKQAMRALDGKVPYALAAGNHDYGPGGGARNRNTLLNFYFRYDDYKDWPTFGGAYQPGAIDNTYHTFKIHDRDWIVFALEWAPRDPVLDWVHKVLDDYPNHLAILITHAYMFHDETRYDFDAKGRSQQATPRAYGTAGDPDGSNDGQDMWDKLVSKRKNFVLTLNGHVLGDGQALLSTRGEEGNMVHQILCNYQMIAEGGTGYLRLMEFLPDGETIQCRSYSPSLDRYNVEPQHQYTLKIDNPLIQK